MSPIPVPIVVSRRFISIERSSRAAIGKKDQQDRWLAIRIVGDFDYGSFG